MHLHVLLFFLLSSSAVVTGVGEVGVVHHQDRSTLRSQEGASPDPVPIFPQFGRVSKYGKRKLWCRAFFEAIDEVSRIECLLYVHISCHKDTSSTSRMD